MLTATVDVDKVLALSSVVGNIRPTDRSVGRNRRASMPDKPKKAVSNMLFFVAWRVQDVEAALQSAAHAAGQLEQLHGRCVMQLEDLVELVRGPLTDIERRVRGVYTPDCTAQSCMAAIQLSVAVWGVWTGGHPACQPFICKAVHVVCPCCCDICMEPTHSWHSSGVAAVIPPHAEMSIRCHCPFLTGCLLACAAVCGGAGHH